MVTGHDNILWIIKHSWLIFYLHVCKFWHKSLLPTIFFLLILSLLYFLKMHYNEFFNINRIIVFSLANFNCTLTVLCSFFIPFCFDVAFLWPYRESRYSSSCHLVSCLVLLIKEFTSMSTELYFVTQWSISIISALLCLARCLLLTLFCIHLRDALLYPLFFLHLTVYIITFSGSSCHFWCLHFDHFFKH